MFGSFQTSNHHVRIASNPKRGSVTNASRNARTSVCHASSAAGGFVGDGDTSAGKKLSCTNGINPRVVSASRPANVGSKLGVWGSEWGTRESFLEPRIHPQAGTRNVELSAGSVFS